MIIIKFGGSVITDKKVKYKFRPKVTDRLVKEFKPSVKRNPIILVHGAGSFGHILSKKYELDQGFRSAKQLAKVAEVKKDVRELNLKILKILIKNNLNPISVSPSSVISNNKKKISKIDLAAFVKPMDLRFIPVTYGDIVMDRSLGFSICSGDQIILHLARKFKPARVIFVTDVDGVFTRPPVKGVKTDLIDNIDINSASDLRLVNEVKSEMNVADVTGGIFEKLHISMEIAKNGVKTDIINGSVTNRLRDSIEGKKVVGTRIHG